MRLRRRRRAVAGLIVISDPVKAEAADAVARLERDGIEAWLVTGDGRATADAVAAQVGIPAHRVLADVRPAEKADVVARLQADGRIVAMVGDGINDAPALALADVGIAIGTGADVAIEASDITLIGGDPRGVAAAIDLSRATMRIVRQNLGWAFGYNIVLIPVAMGVLYPVIGLTLGPVLAAAAMALSSVSVVTNSLRLRSFDATTRPTDPGQASVTRRKIATAFWPPNPKPSTATVSTFGLARGQRHVVQVALGIGRVQVRGRRDDAVADGADRGERAGDPGGPDEVADHRLRRADRDLVGVRRRRPP